MTLEELTELTRHQELEQIVEERWKREAFRRFQCIWLSQIARMEPKRIAETLDLSLSTVRRVISAFQRDGRIAIEGRGNRGGRRRGHMTRKEEAAFLDSFSQGLSKGKIHTINALKIAYEAKIGKKVNKTTIYRLLERHGWGNVATRIHQVPLCRIHDREVNEDGAGPS